MQKLDKLNSLQPFGVLKLEALYQIPRVVAKSREADELLIPKIPKNLDGLQLQIVYYDEARGEHRTAVKIDGQKIVNTRV